ncbi:hypothetical protein D9M71_730020 [compost metagenome]
MVCQSEEEAVSIDRLLAQPLHIPVSHNLGKRRLVDKRPRKLLVIPSERRACNEDLLRLRKMRKRVPPAGGRRVVRLIDDDQIKEIRRNTLSECSITFAVDLLDIRVDDMAACKAA